MKLATAEQMREIDRRAMQEWGMPGLLLMENAGAAVARAAERLWRQGGESGPVVIACGSGHNGGDGLVAARRLHCRGVPVQALLTGPGEQLRGDAATNWRLACAFGVPLVESPSRATLRRRLGEAGLVVDAVLGTGLGGEVRGTAAEVIRAINAADAPVLAVDLPSGVSSETGAILGQAVQAVHTVTFGLAKVGLYCYPARERCGVVEVADISLPRELLEAEALDTELITPARAAAALPRRWAEMHKGDAGRLLIVAGSPGMTGAAALAANAAVRAGAGLVFLAVPEALNAVLEAKCTEPLTLPAPQTASGALSPRAAPLLLERAAQCDAVVLGPGLSTDPQTAELVAQLTAELAAPLVVDADALNLLAPRPDLLAGRSAPTVLTPHPGELARLRDLPAEQIQADRLSAAREAARDLHAIVILKGAATVIAEPGGMARLNPTGNCGLASGGTGDVLAGMLGAFLAGGSDPAAAAAAGVYYHGRAADLAVETRAARSLAAGDLLDHLPAALREAERA